MTADDPSLLSCDPSICALGRRPHRHCSCGLAMATSEALCSLCVLEEPSPVKRAERRKLDDPLAWDGSSYPSRRRRRVGDGGLDSYRLLISTVLRPDDPDYLRLGGDRVRHPEVQARRSVVRPPSENALQLARSSPSMAASREGGQVLTRGSGDERA